MLLWLFCHTVAAPELEFCSEAVAGNLLASGGLNFLWLPWGLWAFRAFPLEKQLGW